MNRLLCSIKGRVSKAIKVQTLQIFFFQLSRTIWRVIGYSEEIYKYHSVSSAFVWSIE